MALEDFVPKLRQIPIFANVERIFQPITDFIRGNPIVSTAAIGAGVTGLTAAVAVVRKRKKKAAAKRRKKRVTRKRKAPSRRRKKTKAQIRATRLRNLKKARKARRKGKRRIIRGPGLGTREIKHSGKSTKGKTKLVSFKTKSGKIVRFKVRR